MSNGLRLAGVVLAALVLACGERAAPVPPATAASQADDAAGSPATPPTSIPTPDSTPVPASVPTSTQTPSPGPSPDQLPNPGTPPSAPAPSARALVRSAEVVEPSGRALLAADGETVVDPASTFELELGAPVADARLVLLDAGDAHVAATASREVGATTRLSLAPAARLVPGSRYQLRLDGAATRELHDAEGRAYAPVAFTVLVAGTPPPPEPKPKPKRRRR